MKVYNINDLAAVNKKWLAKNKQGAVNAMRSAAERTKALYVGRMNAQRAVDTGRAKSSFKVTWTEEGATLSNEAPYFPVIDLGRRPNRPGPPLEPILQWVLRKRLVQVSTRRADFYRRQGLALPSHIRATRGATRAQVNRSGDLMKKARSLAFVIRRSIQRKGIKPREITTEANTQALVLKYIHQALREAGMQVNHP